MDGATYIFLKRINVKNVNKGITRNIYTPAVVYNKRVYYFDGEYVSHSKNDITYISAVKLEKEHQNYINEEFGNINYEVAKAQLNDLFDSEEFKRHNFENMLTIIL